MKNFALLALVGMCGVMAGLLISYLKDNVYIVRLPNSDDE